MKKLILLAALMMVVCWNYAQCPVSATLKSTGNCPGDTLTVSTSDTLSQIVWYNGNIMDTVIKAVRSFSRIITVAGGNGPGISANQLNQPTGIYVDASGNLFIADYMNSRIQEWSPGAASGITVAGGNGLGFAANQIYAPAGVYVDKNGDIYASNENDVKKWSPGATSGVIVAGGNGQGIAPNQLWGAWGVFLDAAGNLYVSDEAYNRVQKFPPGSTSATNGVTVAGYSLGVSGNGPGFLFTPLGIFVDAAGNLYVADENNFRIQKFAPGATSGITVAGGNGSGTAANQFICPVSVVVDNMGNIFVSDPCAGHVQEWLAGADSGITVAGKNGYGSGFDELLYPEGIFLDNNGNLYISDSQNNRVLKYELQSTIDTIYIPRVPGSYRAVVANNAGCTDTTNSITIKPNLPDSLSIISSAAEACAGSPAIFSAMAFNGGANPSYQWLVNGSNTGTGGPVFTDSLLVNGDNVSCLMINNNSCALPAASNIISVIINPLPQVYAGNDTVITPGASVQLNPIVSGTINSYAWTPSAGLNNPLIPAPVAAPAITTTYLLTVISDNGCTGSGKINIVIYRALRMPTAFTPNGDGKNDVFRIPPSTVQKVINFSVYDRWGNRVFMTENSGDGWDGSFNNKQQPAGTYVWEIEYYDLLNGKPAKASGTVILVR